MTWRREEQLLSLCWKAAHQLHLFKRHGCPFWQVGGSGYNKRILEEAWEITLILGHNFSLLYFSLLPSFAQTNLTLCRNLAFPFRQGSRRLHSVDLDCRSQAERASHDKAVSSSFCVCFILTLVKNTQHKIYHLNHFSVAFSTFILCKHHHHPPPELLSSCRTEAHYPSNNSLFPSPPSPWQPLLYSLSLWIWLV